MAHGKQDADGQLDLSQRDQLAHRCRARRRRRRHRRRRMQSAWAAWRFTGDDKYLRPILSRARRRAGRARSPISTRTSSRAARQGATGRKKLTGERAGGDVRALRGVGRDRRHQAGSTRCMPTRSPTRAQHQYMYTEGPLVVRPRRPAQRILQRERLGGIALRRNQTWPGNTRQLALRRSGRGRAGRDPGARRDAGHVQVIAYNISDDAAARRR